MPLLFSTNCTIKPEQRDTIRVWTARWPFITAVDLPCKTENHADKHNYTDGLLILDAVIHFISC